MQLNISKYADLVDAKTKALVEVDKFAGIARQKYFDKLPGEESVMREKMDEIKALLQDPSPTPADYPFVNAEAEARGITFAQAAQFLNNQMTQWRDKMVLIEKKRVQAKVNIDNATTTREVQLIINNVETAVDVI
jgi:hypothetical protein